MTLDEYERYSNAKVREKSQAPTVYTYYRDQGGVPSSSNVSASSAMQVSAYYAAVSDKARTIGQLPLQLYRVKRGIKEKVTSGRLHTVFTKRPTSYMTMQQFLETLVIHNEMYGGYYAEYLKNDRGNPMEIRPVIGGASEQFDQNGQPFISYVRYNHTPVMTYDYDNMLVIKKATSDGLTPISPIQAMARTLKIAVAEDDMAEKSQDSRITANFGLKTEQKITGTNAKEEIRESFNSIYGSDGFREIPVFDRGLEPFNFNISSKDSQLLESREFTVDNICSMVGTMEYRIRIDSEKMPAKGVIPELDEAFMRNFLNPELIRIENALNHLLPDDYTVEFNRRAYYAGSPERLVDSVSKEVSMGLATLGQGQEALGREPDPRLTNIMAIDTNNITLGTIEQLVQQANSRTTVLGDNTDEQANQNEEL